MPRAQHSATAVARGEPKRRKRAKSGRSLSFLGATGTVTGSKTLVEWGSRRFLIDCGLFQGFKRLRLRNREPLPIEPKKIEAVVLTHAHLDHSGYLPLLFGGGFRGKIYATPATRALCQILLRDAAKIQELDAEYANRKGFSRHRPARPLFTTDDAEGALDRFESVEPDAPVKLARDLAVRLVPAGHILGAAQVRLESPDLVVHWSGDLGRAHDPVMRPPVGGASCDYLVVESTYGNRLHPDHNVEGELADVIGRTVARGGSVLVPAFAVGRAHALLYYLQKLMAADRIPEVPVFLDSPMAVSAMEVYCRYRGDHRLDEPACKRTCNVARYVRHANESKALNRRTEPAIIVSASGMLAGGRVLHHLRNLGPNRRNTILLTGFQAGGTRGARLLAGERRLKMHGQRFDIAAEVAELSALSAHADANELIAWLRSFPTPPRQLFITHGSPDAADALRLRVEEELGWSCTVPEHRDRFDLDRAAPRDAGSSP